MREAQLYELWQKWDHPMYPINPMDWQDPEGHEDYPSDSWLVPGSTAYFQFFGARLTTPLVASVPAWSVCNQEYILCFVCPFPPVLVMIW